jgi:hypothetical protein
MEHMNILYTPLDIPEPPKVDIPKLRLWIDKYKDDQIIKNRTDSSKILSEDEYPWDLIWVRNESEWYEDFTDQFPELSNYCIEGFNLNPEDAHSIVFLPIKKTFTGLGFWHADHDEHGLRFYLENNETEDFLYIKPTSNPCFTRDQLVKEQKFQDRILSAKLLKPNQAFFINNVRAVHAVHTTELSPTRIAVIIAVPKPLAGHKLRNLLISSAKKFKDHALYWTPENKS